MASILSTPSALLSPLPKPQWSCSQAPRPPLQPPQPQSPPPPPPPLTLKPIEPPNPKPVIADSTDWIASTLTRRFGLGAGLAWAGFLAAGVVSEQIKTRLEASQQESNTKDVGKEEEVTLPNGIRYYEARVGGGAVPRSGDLVVIDLKGRVIDADEAFVDTFGEGRRSLALVLGSRPYTKGMCEGVEHVLRSMRAGGRRRLVVPPELGFGNEGADFGGDVRIPPRATLEFVVQMDKLLLAVGTKLAHVMSLLAHDVAEKHSAIEGDLIVKPSDDHLWFGHPKIVLYLIHFILFQNTFKISFFFWILTTYGFDSCIMGKMRYMLPRLVIGLAHLLLGSIYSFQLNSDDDDVVFVSSSADYVWF